MTKCLLDGITTSACSPTNAIHTGFHGVSGEGGRVGSAGVPKDYRNTTLTNSPVRESQAQAYAVFDAYVSTFSRQFEADGERIKSLYLWSESPGTGKTTSASALLNEWLIRHYVGSIQRGRTPLQRPAYFLDANELQTEYNAFNRPRVPDSIANPAAERYYNAINHAKHTPFVVIDDVGVRDVSDGFRGDFHSIVNYRVTAQLPTVYTSNIPMKELPRVFGEERLYDRMRDMTQEIAFGGESKRGKR
ncbi:DNA replication protein DnaC [Oceanobacillus limi]|uniref:DNA replication protein DnaC n=1 Tax=Oceanobacillus limi TaxID=930131 RepID=A0A1I0EEG2_9BACI|nr:DNA replication protein [Oceanobacillus limi]SET43152.1 DNA replication protein DnaC [Oceanobacillus limi]